MTVSPTGPLRSLRRYNFRLWAGGSVISNIGTGVQRTAQDWLVLVVLTQHSAAAVGIVMALQFAPQLLLLPWRDYACENYRILYILDVEEDTLPIFPRLPTIA